MKMFLQLQLRFENGIVADIFFVPGYDIQGSLVAQVFGGNSCMKNETLSVFISFVSIFFVCF